MSKLSPEKIHELLDLIVRTKLDHNMTAVDSTTLVKVMSSTKQEAVTKFVEPIRNDLEVIYPEGSGEEATAVWSILSWLESPEAFTAQAEFEAQLALLKQVIMNNEMVPGHPAHLFMIPRFLKVIDSLTEFAPAMFTEVQEEEEKPDTYAMMIELMKKGQAAKFNPEVMASLALAATHPTFTPEGRNHEQHLALCAFYGLMYEELLILYPFTTLGSENSLRFAENVLTLIGQGPGEDSAAEITQAILNLFEQASALLPLNQQERIAQRKVLSTLRQMIEFSPFFLGEQIPTPAETLWYQDAHKAPRDLYLSIAISTQLTQAFILAANGETTEKRIRELLHPQNEETITIGITGEEIQWNPKHDIIVHVIPTQEKRKRKGIKQEHSSHSNLPSLYVNEKGQLVIQFSNIAAESLQLPASEKIYTNLMPLFKKVIQDAEAAQRAHKDSKN